MIWLQKKKSKSIKKTRLPIILIMKSSQHSKFEKYRSEFITPIYEPINVSKLVKVLEQDRSILPKTVEVPKPETPVKKSTKKVYGKKFSANVLVAEDNEINQKLIRRTLEGLGLQLTIVPNGKLALEQRMINEYDVIFYGYCYASHGWGRGNT